MAKVFGRVVNVIAPGSTMSTVGGAITYDKPVLSLVVADGEAMPATAEEALALIEKDVRGDADLQAVVDKHASKADATEKLHAVVAEIAGHAKGGVFRNRRKIEFLPANEPLVRSDQK